MIDTSELSERIRTRSVRIGVVGLGYVGLPLALAFADEDFTVLGFDVGLDDRRIVDRPDRLDGAALSVTTPPRRRTRRAYLRAPPVPH